MTPTPSSPQETNRGNLPALPYWPERIVSLRALALALQGVFAIWVGFAGIAIVIGAKQRSLIHRAQTKPWTVTFDELAADSDRADALNAMFVGLMIITGILFIVWFHRAYRNVEAVGTVRRYRAGWAIGGWLIPFVNLYVPKRIADDIGDAVTWGARATGHDDEGVAVRFWLNAWWWSWIAVFVTGLFARSANRGTYSLDQTLTMNSGYLVRDFVLAVAAILAFIMVRTVTKSFTRLATRTASS